MCHVSSCFVAVLTFFFFACFLSVVHQFYSYLALVLEKHLMVISIYLIVTCIKGILSERKYGNVKQLIVMGKKQKSLEIGIGDFLNLRCVFEADGVIDK